MFIKNAFAALIEVKLPTDPLSRYTSLGGILGVVMNFAFFIALAVTLAFGIISGLKLASSQGDKLALQTARKSLMWSIIGFIVVIGFRSIIEVILGLLGSTGTVPTTIPGF